MFHPAVLFPNWKWPETSVQLDFASTTTGV
eukprot:COSAG06_NODE_60059_length_272_cov_0.601156_1_plen_29_part_01